MILEKMTAGAIKNLSIKELQTLAQEIRLEIIDTVITNGGHLAGNLGVVELTIALHYVFDFPKDKLILDVGHQCYTHKLLTGRYDKFKTLRKKEGISGFPKKAESEYDVFDSGHSGNSISVGLGLARARDLKGDKYEVISLIGDASLTSGMSLEALNDGGSRPSKQIIILNDNNMSIAGNVGAVSTSLNKLRINSSYKKFKKVLVRLMVNSETKRRTLTRFKRIKDSIKYMLMEGVFFEEFGLKYLGPIDGHNLPELIDAFKLAKTEEKSIIVHAVTTKGKGCIEAEQNPEEYHGIGPMLNSSETHAKSFSSAFGEILTKLAQEDDKIVAVTAAMCNGTGLTEFASKFPQRFFDVGIAEGHAVTMSAGLALGGYKPYFAVYSSFLQRGFDQIFEDVALQDLPVRLCIDRSGLVGADGETHQGIYDIGYLSLVPGLTVVAPASQDELEDILRWSLCFNKPLAIKYPKGTAQTKSLTKFTPFRWRYIKDDNSDTVILAVGAVMCAEAYKAAAMLFDKGIQVDVINANFIKPLDEETLRAISGKRIITVEDNIENGSFGSLVAEFYSKNNIPVNIMHRALRDEFVAHARVAEILEDNELSAKKIAESILSLKP